MSVSGEKRPFGDFAQTGIEGLDNIINGGFPRGHMYLLQGEPGTGKTTVALEFLITAVKLGERALYVTLSETESELRYTAESHGWTLEGIELMELTAFEKNLGPEAHYTVFDVSDVDLGDTIRTIQEAIERTKPDRVVFDSLSEMRLLARDPARFRREILSLKQFFADRGVTVLLLDDLSYELMDGHIQSIVHGILRLERLETDYGAERRRLVITKLRASSFRGGYHDYRIVTGGLKVYPRLVASEHRVPSIPGNLLSGVENLDQLLGGGLERGTSTLVMGPAGAGKSTIVTMYALAAAAKGDKCAIFIFDENVGTLLARCEGLGLPIKACLESGSVILQQVDPAEMSPGEFIQLIREAIEKRQVQHVVIDSLNGFLNAMPGERLLTVQLHEMLSYMNQMGVTTMMTNVQHGFLGSMVTQADLSYLADTIILLRFFEAAGEVRQAISVMKKRTGPHERTIREMQLTRGGMSVSEPLKDFRGVLTGVPTYDGDDAPLIRHRGAKSV